MPIKSFKRYEKKYLLNKEEYDLLIPRLLEYMDYDINCINGKKYEIHNIYFDTENNDVISHSISNPYFKEKLRLRSYNLPKSLEDIVFLELKKKIRGIVNKRRLMLTLNQAYEFLYQGIRPNLEGYMEQQVMNEIEYYIKCTKIKPKLYIWYKREAFFAKNDNEFRITIDSSIITRRNNLALEKGNIGELLLDKNQYLMEVKILGSIPLWLTKVFSEHKLYSIHFSKYGNEFMKYCEDNQNKLKNMNMG